MFEGIGRLHDYLRRNNLQLMANQKIATGQTFDLNHSQGKSTFTQPSVSMRGTQKSTSSADKLRMAAIRQKLKNGDKLSSADMRYLKENDTALYRKARVIESAREELERDLKQARTKGEARLAMVRAAMKVSSEAAMADATGAGDVAPNGAGERAAAGVAAPSGPSGGEEAAPGQASSTGVSEKVNITGNGEAASGTQTAAAKQTAENAEKEVQAAIASAMKAATDIMQQTETENQEAQSTLTSFMDHKDAGDTDGAMPPTELLIIRALQKTWMAYINSDAYKDLPNDTIDEEREKERGVYGVKAARRKGQLEAAFSYHKAHTMLCFRDDASQAGER